MAGRVRVRVTLRLTVSQSVCLGVEPNLGLLTRDFFFFKLQSSLTRGRICHLSVYSLSTVVSIYIKYLHIVLYTFDIYNICRVLDTFTIKTIEYNIYNIYRPRSVQALHSRLCPNLVVPRQSRHLNSRTRDRRQV
jgi:hypothetical protein